MQYAIMVKLRFVKVGARSELCLDPSELSRDKSELSKDKSKLIRVTSWSNVLCIFNPTSLWLRQSEP